MAMVYRTQGIIDTGEEARKPHEYDTGNHVSRCISLNYSAYVSIDPLCTFSTTHTATVLKKNSLSLQ